MARDLETIPIARLNANYYSAYADLPVTGLRVGETGFATDRLVFYRWSGTAWQAITIHSSSGLAANIPAAATLPNGSLYFETDTGALKQVQAGAWVIISSATPGEGHILILPWAYNSIGQGTWVLGGVSANYLFQGGLWYNSTKADLDNISYKVYLSIGTYTLRLYGRTANDHGIVDIDLDADEIASFDGYSAGVVDIVAFSKTGIVVSIAGLKTLKLRLDGKNASSTAFQHDTFAIALWRTA